jgi:hypothetical protein
MSYVWSFSNLDMFGNCPRQFKHKHILKEKEPETEASIYGTRVHKSFEERLRDDKPLTSDLQKFEPLCMSIKAKGVPLVEQRMGIARDGSATSFFGKDVWGRGVIDVALVGEKAAWVGDWKTGKKREKSEQQKVFSLFLFHTYPQLETVKGNYIWLQNNEIGNTYTFRREDVPLMWKELLPRIEAVHGAIEKDSFPPKPSGLCRGWCGVSSCEFWQRKQ